MPPPSSPVPELSRVGGSAAIVSDAEQVYLTVARTAEGGFVVASSHCTHGNRPLMCDPGFPISN